MQIEVIFLPVVTVTVAEDGTIVDAHADWSDSQTGAYDAQHAPVELDHPHAVAAATWIDNAMGVEGVDALTLLLDSKRRNR